MIVGGGPHATVAPADCFRRIPQLKAIFRGEAEVAWDGFMQAVKADHSEAVVHLPHATTAVATRPISPRPMNLDVLPEVDRESLLIPYYDFAGRRETSIMAARGCRYNCSYCAGRVLSGGCFRFRSVQRLVDEMAACVFQNGIRSFHFADDNFLQAPEYLRSFAGELRRRGLTISWRSFARADSVTPDLMEDLVSSGCYRLTFGLESGSERTLARMNKHHTLREAVRAIELSQKNGIETKAFFMLGYPGETVEEMLDTINFALSVPLDHAYFYLVRSFPGTKLQRELLDRGYSKEELSQYVHWIPPVEKTLTPEEQTYRRALESHGVFRLDSVLKYNVAHARSINEYCSNDELMEIMGDGYRRFYFRGDYLSRHEWWPDKNEEVGR